MKEIDVTTLKNINSLEAEAYRALRTSIQLLSSCNQIKTIIVTSANPDEGKTTIVSNLAVSMTQLGKKVLIVDCNQRKSKIHKVFSISNNKGLSNILINEVDYKEVINKSFQDNLYIITSGSIAQNPSELLASNNMKILMEKLKSCFDYIILDTPSVNGLTDTQLLSQYADGCILVVACGKTKKSDIIKAKNLLEKVSCRILGVVLNKVKITKKDYCKYF